MACSAVVLLFFAAQITANAAEASLADAAERGDFAAVKTLLDQKVDASAPQADGMTALHWAAQKGDLDMAQMLLRAGARANAVTRYGVTALSLACANGSAEMVAALLAGGADPNLASPEGETPLMMAARVGTAEPVKLLLARGASVNSQEKWKGQSALMWAAGEGQTAAIQVLLETGADVGARSNGGFTPLLFAVRNGHLEAARLLLASGADPNDKVLNTPSGAAANQDRYGRRPANTDPPTSALGIAVINAYYDLALLLLEKGADPNIADPRGSVLHAIAFMRRPGSGNPPLRSGSVDTLELARALLAHGANPNVRISWREIPFDRDLAATRLPPNISVGRNFLSFVGATPFYVAAKHGVSSSRTAQIRGRRRSRE